MLHFINQHFESYLLLLIVFDLKVELLNDTPILIIFLYFSVLALF